MGCDRQNEPPGSLLAGHWGTPPLDRLHERKWDPDSSKSGQKVLIIGASVGYRGIKDTLSYENKGAGVSGSGSYKSTCV